MPGAIERKSLKRVLVLFPKEWDRLEFTRPQYASRYEFVYAGFDLFRFPQNLRLATFDVFRFVNEIVARFRSERIDGVFSNNDYFGALYSLRSASIGSRRAAR